MPNTIAIKLEVVRPARPAVTLTYSVTNRVAQVVGNVAPPIRLTINAGNKGDAGPAGPQGPIGPQGPPGSSSAGYRHVQPTPASVWTINHGLGYWPGGIFVFDSAGSQWEGEVSFPDVDVVVIDFGVASFSGFAYVS